MAISVAVKKSTNIHVYDDKGRQIFSQSAGSGSRDGLVGYSSNTVSIRRGTVVVTYDEKGRQLSSTSAS